MPIFRRPLRARHVTFAEHCYDIAALRRYADYLMPLPLSMVLCACCRYAEFYDALVDAGFCLSYVEPRWRRCRALESCAYGSARCAARRCFVYALLDGCRGARARSLEAVITLLPRISSASLFRCLLSYLHGELVYLYFLRLPLRGRRR